ncbi:hypothetical protein T492DRAFT_842816 [Pavlovales sp. CCMP2436]|nr:hypothetical protein T492DRAFT_842816 [Pavlovales sp. CCMP2436]
MANPKGILLSPSHAVAADGPGGRSPMSPRGGPIGSAGGAFVAYPSRSPRSLPGSREWLSPRAPPSRELPSSSELLSPRHNSASPSHRAAILGASRAVPAGPRAGSLSPARRSPSHSRGQRSSAAAVASRHSPARSAAAASPTRARAFRAAAQAASSVYTTHTHAVRTATEAAAELAAPRIQAAREAGAESDAGVGLQGPVVGSSGWVGLRALAFGSPGRGSTLAASPPPFARDHSPNDRSPVSVSGSGARDSATCSTSRPSTSPAHPSAFALLTSLTPQPRSASASLGGATSPPPPRSAPASPSQRSAEQDSSNFNFCGSPLRPSPPSTPLADRESSFDVAQLGPAPPPPPRLSPPRSPGLLGLLGAFRSSPSPVRLSSPSPALPTSPMPQPQSARAQSAGVPSPTLAGGERGSAIGVGEFGSDRRESGRLSWPLEYERAAASAALPDSPARAQTPTDSSARTRQRQSSGGIAGRVQVGSRGPPGLWASPGRAHASWILPDASVRGRSSPGLWASPGRAYSRTAEKERDSIERTDSRITRRESGRAAATLRDSPGLWQQRPTSARPELTASAAHHVLRVSEAREAARLLALHRPNGREGPGAKAARGESCGHADAPADAERAARIATLLARMPDSPKGRGEGRGEAQAGSERTRVRRSFHQLRSRARAADALGLSSHGIGRAIQRPTPIPPSAAHSPARARSPTAVTGDQASATGLIHAAQLSRLTALARAVRLLRVHAYEHELRFKLKLRDRRRRMRTTACSDIVK